MKKPDPSQEYTIPKTTGQLVRVMVRPYLAKSAVFFGLTLLGMLAWTASPVMISQIVTRLGQNSQLTSTIWVLTVVYFVLRFLDETFWRIGELVMRTFKPQMVERVRTILFSATLKKPHAFYVNSSSGRIGHWINEATSTSNDLIDVTIWNTWGRIVGLVFSTMFLFLVHWSLAVVFGIWLILLFWYTTHRGREFGRLIAIQSDEASKASGIVVDSLSNHLSVRVFNARARERNLLLTQQHRIIKAWRRSWMQNLYTNIIKGQSAAVVSGLALVLVLWLFAHHYIPLGGIVLFITYFGDASSSLWELAWSLDSYYRNFGTIQNALDGLNAEDEREGETVATVDLPERVSLSFDKVSFAYPDQPEQTILKSLSFEVAEGQKVGVVGHSGAGKSTLVGLLLGFYKPTGGAIKVNQLDTQAKDPSYMRDLSSFVPQDTNLFNRTIRENVTYARPEATDSQVNEALKRAEALEFVKRLPHGLDTLIGERGIKLSGGQRQRIAIARAILKDAPLLLLDEATSALDSVSEQSIQRSLHNLMQDRTSLVIAHRLSTLKHLDKIIVIDKGKIVEEGTHEALIRQGGIYADLWKRQKDGFIVD